MAIMSEPVALLVPSLCKSRLGCAKLGARLNVVSAVASATEKGCFANVGYIPTQVYPWVQCESLSSWQCEDKGEGDNNNNNNIIALGQQGRCHHCHIAVSHQQNTEMLCSAVQCCTVCYSDTVLQLGPPLYSDIK